MEIKTINKAYKTELKPNKEQAAKLELFCHVSRKVYNWGLDNRIKALESKTKISKMSQQVDYTLARKELHDSYCPDFPRVAMEYTLEAVDNAFKNYFRKKKEGKNHKESGFPKFKSVHKSKLSFRCRPSVKQIESSKIYITNIGWINLKEKGYIPNEEINKVNFATVSKESGRWFISVTVEQDIVVEEATGEPLGLDRGIKHAVICSDGTYYDNPKALAKNEKKLKRFNRELSRRTLRSANWYKTKEKINKLHIRIARIRVHMLHNITKDIVVNKNPAVIGLEDLNVAGMVKNEKLAKSISDVSMSTIEHQINYKSDWHGCKVVKIDRFYPSSKTCSICGNIKNDLKLSDRTYKCEACSGIIDRDLNASINIKREALRTLTI